MDQQSSFLAPKRGFICASMCLFFFLLPAFMVFSETQKSGFAQEREPADILWDIYGEVVQYGHFSCDNFLKGEFHVNLDGNEENREEHVVVLNHWSAGRERMLLQVTYFESRRKNSPVKYARCVREIDCCIIDKRIEIERCDYSNTEMSALLSSILEGIRDEKKMLDLIKE